MKSLELCRQLAFLKITLLFLSIGSSIHIIASPLTELTRARPSVEGSFPSDGAKGLVRNAFISLGILLPNEGFSVDVNTLNDSTVRLFPIAMPDSLVEAYVTTDPELGNITFEPVEVLEPNTEYIFELTEDVKDGSGASFIPFIMRFSTGEIALKKHITLNKPRLRNPEIAMGTRVSFKPDVSKLIAATSGKTSVSDQSAEIETKSSVEKQAASTSENKEVKLTPSSPKENTAINKDEPNIQNTNENKEVDKEVISPKDKPSEETALKDSEPKDRTSEAALAKKREAARHINFPKKELPLNSKMPILFSTETGGKVQLMMRSKAGKVVKRRTGSIEPGRQRIFVSLEGIPAGVYIVMIKAADYALSQRITIK